VDTVYQPYYFEEMKGVKHDISVVNDLVKYRFPTLHAFLTRCEISIDNTILSWTICLFMNMNLSFEVKSDLMEYILVYKKTAVYKAIIYCVKKVKRELVQCSNIVDCNNTLKDVERFLERPDIISEIIDVTINEELIKKLAASECQNFHNDQYIFKEEGLDLRDCMIRNYFYGKNHKDDGSSNKRYSQALKVSVGDNTLTKTIFQRYRIFTINEWRRTSTL